MLWIFQCLISFNFETIRTCSLTFKKDVGTLKKNLSSDIRKQKYWIILSVPRWVDHILCKYIIFCEQNLNRFVVTSIQQVLANVLTIQLSCDEKKN